MSSETKLVCSTCISCPKEEILRRLQRETTCSACCSALRLMTERPLAELVLLDSFVDREDETGYVLNEDLASPAALEAACAKFPLQEWLKNCQPLKRDKRCPMHTNSRHIFNQADLWEDMWAELSAAQKATICAVGAGELHDKLWQHCTDKHHLCKDCRSNVMWAYDRLTKKELPPVGTEAEQEAELSSLQAYFDIERSTEGCACAARSARAQTGDIPHPPPGRTLRAGPSACTRRRCRPSSTTTRTRWRRRPSPPPRGGTRRRDRPA